jgi:hypothetical protein
MVVSVVDCHLCTSDNTRAAAPPHTRLCLPFARLKNLTQLRIGCAHLEVEQGRSVGLPCLDRTDSAGCVQVKASPGMSGGCNVMYVAMLRI